MGLCKYRFTVINQNRMRLAVGGKVGFIKALRELFGIGLKEAKDIADDIESGPTEREFTMIAPYVSLDDIRTEFGVDITLVKTFDFSEPGIVYVVKRQLDTTEGRGPMALDAVFTNRTAAAEYIDDKPGVMGRLAKWSTEKYGDWTIEEFPLYNNAAEKNDDVIAEQKAKALAKLTAYERKILGLE